MIQAVVLSGKGGTGKTTLTAALATLLPGRKILVDADVDAANLAVTIRPTYTGTEVFHGMDVAVIDPSACIACGSCMDSCRFEAITFDEQYTVNPVECEGCAVCTIVCPVDAVRMEKRETGYICEGRAGNDLFIGAELYPGMGNSGLLIHKIREKARRAAGTADLILIDGPPGIGCPVRSAVTGVHLVILVTEPTLSALHDLRRLVPVCRQFCPQLFLVLNKADLHPGIATTIREYASGEGMAVLGEIPYDPILSRGADGSVCIADASGPGPEAIRKIATDIEKSIYSHGTG